MTSPAVARPALVAEFLDALACRVEAEWARHGGTFATFRASALAALASMPPAGILTTDALADFILRGSPPLPIQTNGDTEFADPSVTLFRTARFSIEVNFWKDSTTAIHQHAFSGAFAILEGKSVHTEWEFAPDTAVSPSLLIGRLSRKASEVLRPGDIRGIEAGRAFAHSLFHLTRPAVTLVIRTDSKVIRDPAPPFLYLPPALALDPFPRAGAWRKQIAIIDFRRSFGGHEAALEVFFAQPDLPPESAVRLLLDSVEKGYSGDVCRDIARRIAGKWPALQASIAKVADQLLHQRTLTRLRTRISDDEGRLLLSLLLLMDGYEGVVSLLQTLGIADPARFLSEHAWRIVSELSGSGAGDPAGYESRVLQLWFEGYTEEATAAALRDAHPEVTTRYVRAIRRLLSDTPTFRALVPAERAGRE